MISFKTGRLAALAVFISILSACAGSPPARIGLAASQPVAELGQAEYSAQTSPTYRIRANDVISVDVFREPDLSVKDMQVGSDGLLSLPLIGPVRAEGLTSVELAEQVRQRLANGMLQHPAVSVNITEYASHLVTVDGAVEKPGVYQFRPGARLSTAIALASGTSRVAKSKEVAVFRKTSDGIAIAKFDYGAVSSGEMLDPVLEPGDRVFVGTSGLSQFWQDLLKALPAFAIFANFKP